MLADCGADLRVQDYCARREPLEIAAQMGHLKVVKFLEEKGAKVSDEKLINEMLKDKIMDTESTKLLQYLVDSNPNCLANNERMLFLLSKYGHFSLLEALIKIGANARAKNKEGLSLLDVIGKSASLDCTTDKKWPKKLEKMKRVLEEALKIKNT
jgi:ankyrin repeat protein